jgi:hypothetical protein
VSGTKFTDPNNSITKLHIHKLLNFYHCCFWWRNQRQFETHILVSLSSAPFDLDYIESIFTCVRILASIILLIMNEQTRTKSVKFWGQLTHAGIFSDLLYDRLHELGLEFAST